MRRGYERIPQLDDKPALSSKLRVSLGSRKSRLEPGRPEPRTSDGCYQSIKFPSHRFQSFNLHRCICETRYIEVEQRWT
jgi:hypothetical protein